MINESENSARHIAAIAAIGQMHWSMGPWARSDELRRLEQSFGVAWRDLLENLMVPLYHEEIEELKRYSYEN